jgi:cell division protein FtsI (penicillin-binding protein 3)
MIRSRDKAQKKKKALRWLRFRIGIILFLFVAFFAVISVRLANLMLINRGELYSLAEKQHRVVSTHITKRGDIYDVNGIDLAVSVEMDSLYACPHKITDADETSRVLSNIIGVDRSTIKKKLSSSENFVWIRRHISPTAAGKIKKLKLPGIGFVKEDKRFYPHKRLGCHFLGFVGTDSQGLSGIEYEMDTYLKSTISHYIALRDANGRKLFEVDISDTPALKNYNLTLTIDLWAQHRAEEILEEGIKESRARGGCIIVMDQDSGEVLAMAGYPYFDPNRFSDADESVWKNRSVSMLFEPGSTFKIFLVSAIIEEKLASSTDLFDCEGGSLTVKDKTFHDITGNFDTLSVTDIITYSSNIGAIKLGMRLGEERLTDYMNAFGFGEETGISLPGEERGIIPEPDSLGVVDLAAASFGQGFLVTPIQLITAASAIANGGFLVEPHIIKRISENDGTVIYEAEPEIRRKVLSDDTAATVREMMEKVVREGTGTRAEVFGFDVAGKTGTAQIFNIALGSYSTSDFIASFVGFLPADDPKVTILVLIDRPKTDIHGGTVAASIFSEFATALMQHREIYPEELFKTVEEISHENEGDIVSPL